MVANNSTKVNPFFIFHTTPTLSITIIQVYLHIRGMTEETSIINITYMKQDKRKHSIQKELYLFHTILLFM